jgi:Ser/Thr protein kinase RdoA (MazF antagonist)
VIDLLEPVLGGAVTLEELKHKPGRRTTYRARGPSRSAIVKVYASERAPTVAARIGALAAGPAEPEIPQVLLCDPERHLVVLTEVPGVPLRHALLEGDAQTCARAGAALGRWHEAWRGLEPEPLALHTPARELEILHSFTERASAAIADVVRARLSAFAACAWTAATVVHRDLYEEQILVGDRIGLIDLDDAALGPPELDIGNLLAHVDLLALRSGGDLSAPTQVLLEAYGRAGASLDADLLERCRCLTILRLACIHGEPLLLDLLPAEAAV